MHQSTVLAYTKPNLICQEIAETPDGLVDYLTGSPSIFTLKNSGIRHAFMR